jgi:hypothetical protein
LPARAAVVVQAETIAMPGFQLTGMQASIEPAAEGGGLRVGLSAVRAEVPAMGWRKVALTLDGTMNRDERQRWLFDGTVRLRGAPGGALADGRITLVIDDAANTLQADIVQGSAGASVALPIDQPTHAQINLKNLPAGWLQGLLGSLWSGRTSAGLVDAQLALDMIDGGIQASGQFALNDVAFDTPAGTVAGQGLNLSGRLGIDTTGSAASVSLDANLRGGTLLLGGIYAQLPGHPVQLSLDARAPADGVQIRRFHLADPDALQLDGSFTFDSKGSLSALTFDHVQAIFPAAYTRYGKTWLATMGLKDMKSAGMLAGSIDIGLSGLRAFAFTTVGLDIADGEGRLGVHGLSGGLDWSASETRPATRLAWKALDVYRIANGPAQGDWRSDGGALTLQRPMAVPVLDGRLSVRSLEWRPAATRGKRLETSMVLTDVDMTAFCRALGWPEFGGKLGGAIPALRYVDDRFELAGGLSLNVFDGFVDITRLSLQQPFGDTPVLTGDISLNRLDLSLLTGVFDFGNITGRMNGKVDDLRLVSWSPVAFKAELLAGEGGRISQQAVSNLTSVGGGSMAAGLQGAVLKLFKTFGYRQIGLNCTLQAAVCRMGGLDTDKDGYTIVQGSGLPRLTVLGHQRDVDWPTLVRRLKAATEGTAPVIN